MVLFVLACAVSDPAVVDDDGDGWSEDFDCDDAEATVFPHADELCDGVDNDCDGEVDEDTAMVYADADGDGVGAGEGVERCEAGAGWSPWSGDCDDADPLVHPGATEQPYNDLDDDCFSETPDRDLDGDGVDAPEDCDDADASATTERRFGEEYLSSAEEVAAVCGGSCPARFDELYLGGTLTTAEGLECVTEVAGTLSLDGATLASVEGLSGLTELGALIVESESLESLEGLEGVGSLSMLVVRDESGIRTLRGLDGLTSVSSATVERTLVSLEGLGALSSVDELRLSVSANEAVELPSLVTVTSYLRIDAGYACVGVPNLVALPGDLSASGCTLWPALEQVSGQVLHTGEGGFPSLRTVGSLGTDAPDATPLAYFPVLERIEGTFRVDPSVSGTVVTLPETLAWIGTLYVDAEYLDHLDASPDLVVDELHFSVLRQDTAESLRGLRVASAVSHESRLTSLAGITADDGVLSLTVGVNGSGLAGIEGLVGLDSLTIEGAYLSDVDDLDGLTSIGGDVTIVSSYRLASLDGLYDVRSIGGDVRIEGNYILGDDTAWAWVDAVGSSNIGGTVTIAGNEW